jgi:hypothetical protein
MVDFLFNKFAVSASVVGTLGCLAWRHTNNGGCCKMMESKLTGVLVYLECQQRHKRRGVNILASPYKIEVFRSSFIFKGPTNTFDFFGHK